MLSGQQPYEVVEQQPSMLAPRAAVLLSAQHPNSLFKQVEGFDVCDTIVVSSSVTVTMESLSLVGAELNSVV